MLTARGTEEDLLLGFEAGADDYLVKPFSPRVMVARVRAILRRSGLETEDGASIVVRGDLAIDGRTRTVLVAGLTVDLTPTEFELLRVLAEHPGWVYSREDLLEQVWGYSYLGDSRLVDVHIANLRKKIGDDPSEPRYIHTVRGAGYKLQPVVTPEAAAGSTRRSMKLRLPDLPVTPCRGGRGPPGGVPCRARSRPERRASAHGRHAGHDDGSRDERYPGSRGARGEPWRSSWERSRAWPWP